jgi:hypothetical protein
MERREPAGQALDGRQRRPGSKGYVAKEIALTSSRRLGVIAEDVVIHEQFLPELWGQNGYCKLQTWRMLWRIFRCMASLFPGVFLRNCIFRVYRTLFSIEHVCSIGFMNEIRSIISKKKKSVNKLRYNLIVKAEVNDYEFNNVIFIIYLMPHNMIADYKQE